MGLIRSLIGSTSGVLADQWKEYIYCDSLDENVLVSRGKKKISNRSSNDNANNNVISNGSIISIANGQCMIIVDNGKIVEACAESGEFKYDSSSEPSIFEGNLGEGFVNIFKNIGNRFEFGGEPPKDQRVYYFNIKEITGNKYGTPGPIPFRVVDQRARIDIDISVTCFGEYSYRIINPILFYNNVCGNVENIYTKDKIDGQLKAELLSYLGNAFSKISKMGIRYSELPSHQVDLANSLNEVMSEKWSEFRGIKIVSIGVSSIKAKPDDENMIKQMQQSVAFTDPTFAAANLVSAQTTAMRDAANNPNGAMNGFMGMGMAQMIGGQTINNLFGMQNNQNQQQIQQNNMNQSWNCSCGMTNNHGNFCSNCGKAKT